MLLSNTLLSISGSATLAMAERARNLTRQGIDVINLSLGEPDFSLPELVKQAAIDAIKADYRFYSPVDGYADLKQAIAHKFKRDNALEYDSEQIVVSTGAKQTITNVFQALLNKGDQVILLAPYWVSYLGIAQLCQSEPVVIPTNYEDDFKIRPEQLEQAITGKTKIVVLNSPNNPCGTVYSEEEYRALAAVLEKYPEIVVLSDEIYEYISYETVPFSFARIAHMYPRTVTINGLSKSFAMTGWRIGYLGAPKAIAQASKKIQSQVTSGANCIAQRAAIAALGMPKSDIRYMIDEFRRRRNLVMDLLSRIEGLKISKPQGAFYVFPDVAHFIGKRLKNCDEPIKDVTGLCMHLLEKAHVALVSGEAFGNPNCLRISYATSENDIRKAIDRIAQALVVY